MVNSLVLWHSQTEIIGHLIDLGGSNVIMRFLKIVKGGRRGSGSDVMAEGLDLLLLILNMEEEVTLPGMCVDCRF